MAVKRKNWKSFKVSIVEKVVFSLSGNSKEKVLCVWFFWLFGGVGVGYVHRRFLNPILVALVTELSPPL